MDDPDFEEDAPDSPEYVQRPPSQNPHAEPQVQYVNRQPQQNFHAEPQVQHMQRPPQPQVQHVQQPPPQNPRAQSHLHYMQWPPQNTYAEAQVQYAQPLPTQNPHAEPQVQYVQPPPQNPNGQFVNVIYVQPPPRASLQQGGHNIPALWASSLYSCMEDPANCFLTLLCPCITFGQIAEIVDENSPSCIVSGGIHGLLCLAGITFSVFFCSPLFWGFAWCYSCSYRNKMRVKYNLAETPCADCLVHCFWEPCALCQEYKELKHRGYDPALGWKGNLRKQQQNHGTMTPPANHTMAR